MRPFAASAIATNNIQVSILAFAGGILLGTVTVYALVLNGLNIGAVLGYTHLYGLDGKLLAFMSPHGYIELTVIFIAGGAGLRIAWAIIQPGLLRRRGALVRAGQEAVLLVIGALPLLLVAGLIEGLVSPSDLPDVLKLIVGLILGLALHLFLLGPVVWMRLGMGRAESSEAGDGEGCVMDHDDLTSRRRDEWGRNALRPHQISPVEAQCIGVRPKSVGAGSRRSTDRSRGADARATGVCGLKSTSTMCRRSATSESPVPVAERRHMVDVDFGPGPSHRSCCLGTALILVVRTSLRPG